MQRMTSSNHLQRHINRVFALIFITAMATAQASDLELGMQYLEMGQTEQAIEIWRPLAKSGNADAQFGMAVIYNDAMGVPQDYIEANYWFLQAAEQGYAPAQYNLGNAYKHGTGMSPDPNMAVIWWRKAAEQGFGPAEYNIGTAYIVGVGIPRDKSIGAEWYQHAAANGHPLAKAYLIENAIPENVAAEESTTAISTPKVEPAEPASVTPTTNTVTTDNISAEAQTPATPVPPTTENPVAVSTSCSEWLVRGTSNGYSIQLMANREQSSSTNYIRQYELADAVVCSYSVKNRIWHAVFYGQYPTAGETRAALATLPEAVRAGGAYPRRLKEIRQAVEASP